MPSVTSISVGRFFSLGNGQVGQYLSSRVLVVRTPFRRSARETCYFGFEKLSQAQKFAQYLAYSGYQFSLQRSQVMTHLPYEIKLSGSAEMVNMLAYWDRIDQKRLSSKRSDTPVAA